MADHRKRLFRVTLTVGFLAIVAWVYSTAWDAWEASRPKRFDIAAHTRDGKVYVPVGKRMFAIPKEWLGSVGTLQDGTVVRVRIAPLKAPELIIHPDRALLMYRSGGMGDRFDLSLEPAKESGSGMPHMVFSNLFEKDLDSHAYREVFIRNEFPEGYEHFGYRRSDFFIHRQQDGHVDKYISCWPYEKATSPSCDGYTDYRGQVLIETTFLRKDYLKRYPELDAKVMDYVRQWDVTDPP